MTALQRYRRLRENTTDKQTTVNVKLRRKFVLVWIFSKMYCQSLEKGDNKGVSC